MYAEGKLSYCPQNPWIFQDNVRQNILFGESMDDSRYRQVLAVCGLVEDVSRMPDGDLTLIGDRGLTLSGGQKARLYLARAVYREADIYLLDDPLSAVDTKVGCHIFESCIKTFLGGKTRILVTHQIQHLPDVDQIIVLEKGAVQFVGSYDNMPRNPKLSDTLCDSGNETQELELRATIGETSLAETMDEKEEGTVQWRVFLQFIQAGGTWLFLICVVLFVVLEVLTVSTYWYLTKWTDVVVAGVTNTSTTSHGEEEELMHVFTGLAVGSILLFIVVEAPLWIFLASAAKRIVLNRFSRDLGFVDLLLPNVVRDLMKIIANICGRLVIVCLAIPWSCFAVAALFITMYVLYNFGTRAFRELKRLEARGRSPVYSHLSETLHGLQSIRIMKREDGFLDRFNQLQDNHTMRWLMCLTSFRWLAVAGSFVFLVFFILVVIVALILKDQIPPAFIGLCITYIITMIAPFEFSFRAAAQLETYMTSVERILNYNKLEQEPAPITEYKLPEHWPEAGDIQFMNVSLHYYEGALAALRDISVTIKSKDKIGIVGRTGSGKSSLVHSLMRLTEPCGHIIIDGVDITRIGLRDLREKISVIPQDPVLFSGTMRGNLDPMNCANEQDLWDVLRKENRVEEVNHMVNLNQSAHVVIDLTKDQLDTATLVDKEHIVLRAGRNGENLPL